MLFRRALFNRQTSARPTDHPAAQVDGLEASGEEMTSRRAAAVARVAYAEDFPIAGKLIHAAGQLAQWNKRSARDMPIAVFRRLSNVEKKRPGLVCEFGLRRCRVDLRHC